MFDFIKEKYYNTKNVQNLADIIIFGNTNEIINKVFLNKVNEKHNLLEESIENNNVLEFTKELIQIYPAAEINYTISPQVTNLMNSNVVFQNITPNCASQVCDLGTLGTSNVAIYKYTFEDVGTYYVGLSVITEDGCVEEITDSVIIEENYVVFTPTSFTPNGDGLNDVFMPVAGGVEDFKLEIYNRWGKVVYSTSNINQPWDGTGNIQDNYIWKVYVKDNTGANREMMGSITLLR